jgi:hypothetical protein
MVEPIRGRVSAGSHVLEVGTFDLNEPHRVVRASRNLTGQRAIAGIEAVIDALKQADMASDSIGAAGLERAKRDRAASSGLLPMPGTLRWTAA